MKWKWILSLEVQTMMLNQHLIVLEAIADQAASLLSPQNQYNFKLLIEKEGS